MNLCLRRSQHHALTEGAQLQYIAVPGVLKNRFPGVFGQAVMHAIFPVIVIEIEIQKVLNVLGTVLQLRNPQAKGAKGEEKIGTEEKLIPECGQIL